MQPRNRLVLLASLAGEKILVVGCLIFVAVAWRPAGDQFVKLTNEGRAYLENRDKKEAAEAFEAALRLEPDDAGALTNLALVKVLLANAPEEGLRLAGEVVKRAPDQPVGHYLMGIACIDLARSVDAIPHLETAVKLDPQVAATHFQLAIAYQTEERLEDAYRELLRTVELDPLHFGAYHRLGSLAQRFQKAEDSKKFLEEFRRIKSVVGEPPDPLNHWKRCKYTQIVTPPPTKPPTEQAIAVTFVDAGSEWLGGHGGAIKAATAALMDIDEDGLRDILTAAPDGELIALTAQVKGPFAAQAIRCGGGAVEELTSAVVADYDNDGHEDCFLVGPKGCRLLKGLGAAAFEDATSGAMLSGVTGVDAIWVDFDHDGDVDLLVVSPDEGGLRFLRNDGGAVAQGGKPTDGKSGSKGDETKPPPTFTDVTEKSGVVDVVRGARRVAAVDVDSNVAIDLIAAGHPSFLLANLRGAEFKAIEAAGSYWPDASAVAADDLNNDGNPDVALAGEEAMIVMYPGEGERHRLDTQGVAPADVVLLDFDNDGWLDVLAVGQGAGLWRNTGDDFVDATTATGLAKLQLPPLRRALSGDLDGDGDTDLALVSEDGGFRLLRNEGGHVNHQLELALHGTKSNRAGIGARIDLRRLGFRAVRTVSRWPIEIGLGERDRLDTLGVVWTNGVVNHEFDVAYQAGEPRTVEEPNVQAGSCPFLYAWDGQSFRFVTDILGNAPMGLSASETMFVPADPDEYVCIGDASALPPRDGRYVIQVTGEFREVLYLDEAAIVAVDHPDDTEVYSTDALAFPPFPPSELWLLGDRRSLHSAVDSRGADQKAELMEIDGLFAPPGELLAPQFRGITRPRSLTFDFGPLDGVSAPVLAMTGWYQYGDASTNVAASQNKNVEVVFPMLEAEAADGRWEKLDIPPRWPAGKTKTVLFDLKDRLPAGARRLRWTSTLQVYWDCAALFDRLPMPAENIVRLDPVSSDLHWRGFSEIKRRAPLSPATPDYDVVSPNPPWLTTPQGWCTRYGPVDELIERSDNRFAILNGGDELTIEFEAGALGPPASGMRRTFFFYSVGWEKDADYHVHLGDFVDPLPFHGMDDQQYGQQSYPAEEGEDWQVRYNTRWVPADRYKR